MIARRAKGIAAALAGLLASGAAWAAPQPALPADSVVDLLGVNTHLSYLGTVYDTGYASIVKPRLLELGVRHIRDNTGNPGEAVIVTRYADLAASGIRLLMPVYPDRVARAKEIVAAANSPVEALEPPNERDIGQQWFNCTPNWAPCLRDQILDLRPQFKNDPLTAALPYLGPAFANTKDSPAALGGVWGQASANNDAGNIHDYGGLAPESAGGGGWGIPVQSAIDRYRSNLVTPTNPLWVTENGYKLTGAVSGHPSVTQRCAAKYLPRSLLYHQKLGVQRYYVYQLVNDNAENFGLLNNDGTPRQPFTAVKSLVSLYADPGPAFATAPLDHAISGSLTGIQQTLHQKRDGRWLLALWQGVTSCTGTTDGNKADVEPAGRALTVTFPGRVFSRIRVFKPTFGNTGPVQTVTAAGGISVTVPDHLTILELTP